MPCQGICRIVKLPSFARIDVAFGLIGDVHIFTIRNSSATSRRWIARSSKLGMEKALHLVETCATFEQPTCDPFAPSNQPSRPWNFVISNGVLLKTLMPIKLFASNDHYIFHYLVALSFTPITNFYYFICTSLHVPSRLFRSFFFRWIRTGILIFFVPFPNLWGVHFVCFITQSTLLFNQCFSRGEGYTNQKHFSSIFSRLGSLFW